MELLELMKYRRSIRKYQDRQISREDMETLQYPGRFLLCRKYGTDGGRAWYFLLHHCKG